jgi:hypothetical protein
MDIDRLEDAVQTSQGHDQCRQLLLVASQICQILAPRHPKLIEDPKAVGTVLMLEEMAYSQGGCPTDWERV